jgi:predicted secreted Zn-dependent protease
MTGSVPAVVYSTLVALAAIASATVAAWHGTIDGQTYAAIVTGTLGLTLGAGIHAAGTQSGTAQAADAAVAAVRPASITGASTDALKAELQRRGTA